MDNEQTTKQIPKLEDAERLKELFEYEMTQVRTGFRKELMQLNAEKMSDTGKDVIVPEPKEIETPVCQINEITVEYDDPDIRKAMEKAVSGEQPELPEPPVLQIPDVPQTSLLKEAQQAVSAPVQSELTLPDAVISDQVKSAGSFENTAVTGLADDERQTIDAALSALNRNHTDTALPEIRVAEASGVQPVETAKISAWQEVQTEVTAPTALNIPELKAQKPEMPAVEAAISGDISVPDTGKTTWQAAEIAVSDLKSEQPLPELHVQAELFSQIPEIEIPKQFEVQIPQLLSHEASAENAPTAVYCVPEQSGVQFPQNDLQSVQDWKPVAPSVETVSDEVKQVDQIQIPNIPLPSAVSVNNDLQLAIPDMPSASGINVSAVSADAEQIRAASPAIPEIPNTDIADSAVSEISLPQKADFDQIQSGLQYALTGAADATAAGKELLEEMMQIANG